MKNYSGLIFRYLYVYLSLGLQWFVEQYNVWKVLWKTSVLYKTEFPVSQSENTSLARQIFPNMS